MKLNRKGFMMAEVVVVSAVVLMTLSTLYISYNKIYSLYRSRLNYNDISTLYRLAYYRDCFFYGSPVLREETISIDKTNLGDDYIDGDSLFMVYNNKNKKLDSNAIDSFNPNQTYKDYVKYLSDSVDFSNSDYVMLIEQCDTNNSNCKYAYLELNKDVMTNGKRNIDSEFSITKFDETQRYKLS